MKAKTLKTFKDTQAGIVRHAGDVFECSSERFSNIASKLKGYVEAIEEEKQTPKTKFKK